MAGLIAVNRKEGIVIGYDWIVLILSCWSRSLGRGPLWTLVLPFQRFMNSVQGVLTL